MVEGADHHDAEHGEAHHKSEPKVHGTSTGHTQTH